MAAKDNYVSDTNSFYEDRKSNSALTSITPKSTSVDGSGVYRKIQVTSNWTTFHEQPLTDESIAELFSNVIPAIRYPKLFSTEECARLVNIIKTAHVVSPHIHL